MVNESKIRS